MRWRLFSLWIDFQLFIQFKQANTRLFCESTHKNRKLFEYLNHLLVCLWTTFSVQVLDHPFDILFWAVLTRAERLSSWLCFLSCHFSSYLHCKWATLEELEKDPRIHQKIKRFRTKQAQMKHLFAEVRLTIIPSYAVQDWIKGNILLLNDKTSSCAIIQLTISKAVLPITK